MLNTKGFLDQLFKTAQQSMGQGQLGNIGNVLGGLAGNLTGGAPKQERAGAAAPAAQSGGLAAGLGSALGGDFGKGALTGGALGVLLGNERLRNMGGKLALYGGVAAVGVLAYKAYGDWQRQQTGQAAKAAPAQEIQTLDRLPAPVAEQHAQAILKALVAAAKADGHVDARERELIEGEFHRIGADPALQTWLHDELAKPLDPAEVAGASSTPEMAAQMYLASLMAVDDTNFMERAYLDELAKQLKLPASLKERLEQEVRTAVAQALPPA